MNFNPANNTGNQERARSERNESATPKGESGLGAHENFLANVKDQAPRSGCLHPLVSPVLFSGEASKYGLSPVQGCSENSVLIPWLNLLWLSSELARSQDQLRWVAQPWMPRQIYDNLIESHLLQKLEAKLMEIYPDSFLFRLNPEQIEYRNIHPVPVSQEHLVNLACRILAFGSRDYLEGETSLAESTHEVWLQILGQIPRTTNRGAVGGYEQLRQVESGEDSRLIWGSSANVKGQPRAESPLAAPLCSASLEEYLVVHNLSLF